MGCGFCAATEGHLVCVRGVFVVDRYAMDLRLRGRPPREICVVCRYCIHPFGVIFDASVIAYTQPKLVSLKEAVLKEEFQNCVVSSEIGKRDDVLSLPRALAILAVPYFLLWLDRPEYAGGLTELAILITSYAARLWFILRFRLGIMIKKHSGSSCFFDVDTTERPVLLMPVQ